MDAGKALRAASRRHQLNLTASGFRDSITGAGRLFRSRRAGAPGSLVQFRGFVSESTLAKRYFVSGSVQGVGFRYFTEAAAERLGIAGYVRNLPDGRVEVYAAGTTEQHRLLRQALERGPRFASVTTVSEEPASLEAKWTGSFVIESGG